MKNLIKMTSFNTFIPMFYPALMLPLRSWRKKAIEMLNFKDGDKILVPGIGTGHDLPFIPEGMDITGIDLSDVMLGIGKVKQMIMPSKSKLNVMKMDAEKLDFPNANFDKAILSLFLSVVFDPRAALSEVLRVTKSGGEIVVYDHFLPDRAIVSNIAKPLDTVLSYGFTSVARTIEDCTKGLPVTVVKTIPGDPLGFVKGYLLIKS